ncbi:MAG TPA: GTPase, partial [Candidatus Korarchaeota archaeon]|nr:GTPase [Candidatus Korarchaeota archaeon]
MVFVLGIAGSGKTTLTHALVSWLQDRGLDVRAVNLDPGAKTLPYDPALDVREIVTVDELMEKRGLGPNGAILEAVEVMAGRRSDLIREMEGINADYLVI